MDLFFVLGMTQQECDILEKDEIQREEEEERKKRNILLDLQKEYDNVSKTADTVKSKAAIEYKWDCFVFF